MKEQTAVEWLINEHFGGIENCTPDFKNKIKQAKEMEKEQIVNAYNDCEWTGDHEDGEQYYNETFNKSINKRG